MTAVIAKVELFLSASVDKEHNGGWAVHMHSYYQGRHIEKNIGGFAKETTATRLTLLALLNGLKQLKLKEERQTIVHIYSSVVQVTSSLNRNMHQWAKNDWMTKGKKYPEHLDLWMQIHELIMDKRIMYKVHLVSQETHHSTHRLESIALSADYLRRSQRELFEVVSM